MGSANSWPRRFGFLKVREGDAPSRLGPFAYPERKHFLPRRNRLSLSPYRRSSLPTAMSPKVTCFGKKMVGDLFWVCRKTIRISNTPPTHTLQGVAKTQQKKKQWRNCVFLFPGNKWPPPVLPRDEANCDPAEEDRRRNSPLELYLGLCERRQGRDDQHPSRTADPESSAHNWPTAESVK